MVYDFYSSRRGYSSRPIVSSYSYSPYFDRSSFYDGGYGTSYSSYYSPMRVTPSYSRVGSFMSRPSFSFSYESKYADVPYGNIKRVISVPITRITTSPSRVYRERSEVRVLTPSARIYRRDVSSPTRVVTSPARICNIRVRPSVLSREFGRIDRKYRSSPFGLNDTEEYLNSAYATNFDDETRDIRASSRRLLKEIHEPVPRPQGLRFGRAQSLQPTYSRFDSDLIDRYGNSLIDNEFHVSKNIIRPTRKTRDQIEILSHFKYPESAKRYTGISHLASAKIMPRIDRPFYTRSSLAHDYDFKDFPTDYSVKLGLDPARPSRKFNEVKEMEDPAVARKEVEALKAANRLVKVQEVDEDLEKIKQKRIEERKLREQQALMEDKVHEKERAKKEEADRQAELQRQERLAAQAAAERQAEIERKAGEEAKAAEEARLQEEAKQAEAKKAAQAAQDAESAKLAEEARIAAEAAAKKQAEEDKKAAEAKAAEDAAAKKAEEERLAELEKANEAEAARLAEEAAAKKAEEERLAELEKLKEDEAKLNELERLANEDEEVELARQANELAEIARQQTEELQNNEPAAETPAEPIVEEAPATPEITEEPIVEAPESPEIVVEESPVVEELATVVEESAAEVAVEEPAAEE